MQRDGGGRDSHTTLATVRLPPLPRRPGVAARLVPPGRPPTPPPRPESSLVAPPPPIPTSSPSSGPGRGEHALQPALPAPLISSLEPGLQPGQPITLTSPRNVAARTQNLYVDTPFSGQQSGLPARATHSCASLPSAVKSRLRPCKPLQPAPLPASLSVICQPGLDKQPLPGPALGTPPAPAESIICVRCGRCRCAACRQAKSLPAVWMCNNTCLCSVESALDTVSCMCCVKAVAYHCGERLEQDCDDRTDSWLDSPCSCSHNKWWLRWGCLALMSLPLPCLLCYPLLKGLASGVERVYAAAASQGCRCPDSAPPQPGHTATPSDSEKRLLG